MTDKPGYWFAVKRYGWGWGLPVRWQGWLVMFGYLGLVYAGVYLLLTPRALATYLIALTALLIVILAWKGERPLRWRWGGD
jgi:hypothetical protein